MRWIQRPLHTPLVRVQDSIEMMRGMVQMHLPILVEVYGLVQPKKKGATIGIMRSASLSSGA